MNNQENILNKMKEIALNNPKKIHIIETCVEADIQIEFFENLQELNNQKILTDWKQLSENLYNPKISTEEKKKILVSLTAYGEVETYRIIENYLKNPTDELKSWTFLAYQQARMFLEAKLLDEEKIYIASSLGGKEHRLRYVFAFFANENFSETQKNVLIGELEYAFNKNDSVLEKIDFVEKYAFGTALIALQIDLISLIQDIIVESNQYGNFLKENIFISNERKIDKTALDEIYNSIEGID